MLELIKKRTPIMIKSLLLELKEQEIDLMDTLSSFADSVECFLPSKSFFKSYKEKNRLLIIKGLFAYEESKNSLNVISKSSGLDTTSLFIKLKSQIDKNIRLMLSLETAYYLKQRNSIFWA